QLGLVRFQPRRTNMSTSTATQTKPQPAATAVTPDPDQPTVTGRGHIGRIVAGTLVSGLVGAVVLVAGPLAGAREHVITGSVLVAFAVAWAMLAVLSERWTDQPQRWAYAPAAFMALTGASILAVAPTGNELGWVW